MKLSIACSMLFRASPFFLSIYAISTGDIYSDLKCSDFYVDVGKKRSKIECQEVGNSKMLF